MSLECDEKGIPGHLHRGEREIDQKFNHDEIVYRRFNPNSPRSTWRNDKAVSAVIFPCKEDSYNRSKYCKSVEDVLYNIKATHQQDHFFHWGVLQIPLSALSQPFPLNQNGSERTFTLGVSHSPEECMYPHCEVIIYENGTIVDGSKPKSTKRAIRDYLIDNCTIAKEPIQKSDPSN